MTARPDLAEIERLLEQITPGDWSLCLGGKGSFAIEDANCIAILCQRAPWPHRAAESEANGRLMASAPTTVRALLARVRELEAALAREPTTQELDGLADVIDGEVGDERPQHMERCVWQYVRDALAALPPPPKEPA